MRASRHGRRSDGPKNCAVVPGVPETTSTDGTGMQIVVTPCSPVVSARPFQRLMAWGNCYGNPAPRHTLCSSWSGDQRCRGESAVDRSKRVLEGSDKRGPCVGSAGFMGGCLGGDRPSLRRCVHSDCCTALSASSHFWAFHRCSGVKMRSMEPSSCFHEAWASMAM